MATVTITSSPSFGKAGAAPALPLALPFGLAGGGWPFPVVLDGADGFGACEKWHSPSKRHLPIWKKCLQGIAFFCSGVIFDVSGLCGGAVFGGFAPGVFERLVFGAAAGEIRIRGGS